MPRKGVVGVRYRTDYHRRLGWRQDSLCGKEADARVHEIPEIQKKMRENYHEMFFKDNRRNTKAAIEVCNRCPVKLECLADAILFSDGGVRGGMTATQRLVLSKKINLFELYSKGPGVLLRDTPQNSSKLAS